MKTKNIKQIIAISIFLLFGMYKGLAQEQVIGKTKATDKVPTETTMNTDALIQMDSDSKGLLLPRIALTGANKVAPLTAHTAGMVIYNTATVPASGTGATAIEAVTPGYYYNNGIKWIKLVSSDDKEWIYKNDTIKLKRSGTAPFNNKVFYTPSGGLRSMDFGMYRNATGDLLLREDNLEINYFDAHNALLKKASRVSNTAVRQAVLDYNFLHLDKDTPASKDFFISANSLTVDNSVPLNIDRIRGVTSSLLLESQSNIGTAIGMSSGVSTRANTSATNIYGSVSSVGHLSSKPLRELLANRSQATLGDGATSDRVNGLYLATSIASNSTTKRLVGIENRISAGLGATAKDVLANHIITSGVNAGANITNMYGLYIQNVDKAKNKNYAIYTRAGKNSLGDSLQIRNINTTVSTVATDKVVVADAQGVLKTKAPADLVQTEWIYENDTIKLKRSGTAPFNNKVFYDEKGGLKSLDFGINSVAGQTLYTENNFNITTFAPHNTLIKKGSEISKANIEHTYLDYKLLYLDKDTPASKTFIISGNSLSTDNNTAFNLNSIQGLNTVMTLTSPGGNVINAVGVNSSVITRDRTSATNIYGSKSTVGHHSSNPLQVLLANRSEARLGDGATSDIVNGLYSSVYVAPNSTTNRLVGIENRISAGLGATAKDVLANHIITSGVNAGANITNMYGLYIQNVDKANSKNYAIYTNAGKVRFGDNVGIGVDAPVEKLEVAGNAKATTFIATASVFPDYVFEKYYTGESSLKSDYSFKTLSEVEAFIKEKGHLPGYLSAKEVSKTGSFDMTATQLINVEKIEELYLHTIEQGKEMELQKKQIEEKDAKIKELEERIELIEKLLQSK